MTGGTLLVSNHVKLHPLYKERLEALGFNDVTLTSANKDGLNFIINDLKPQLMFIGAGFYKCCTPYMMSVLLTQFPDLKIAAVTHSDYPPDLAMWFIFNGVKSFVTLLDGVEEFNQGMECIRSGKCYVSPCVQERIEMCNHQPPPIEPLTKRQLEVSRCLCNGFTSAEISDTLHISESTVNNHKTEIYKTLNIRNENEIIRTVQDLGLISRDELIFFGSNFALTPKATKQPKRETGRIYAFPN